MFGRKLKRVLLAVVVVGLSVGGVGVCAKDIVLEGVYEAALDLPRIMFLLKREPDGKALKYQGRFEANWAFVDTGASGVLLSRETANQLGLKVEPEARFVDVGIGGNELFDVSEPLYMGLADFQEVRMYDPNVYKVRGPGRFQVKREMAGVLVEPIDVIGMPALMRRVLVLDSEATNELGYFAASIEEAGSLEIPEVDFSVSLGLANFQNQLNPMNIPPLPVMSYNPVIDNVVISRRGRSSTGTWLLDTGATVSLISTEQAKRLGIMDENGELNVEPAFSVPLGGVGAMTLVSGFEIDSLSVATTAAGQNLVFKNVRLGVHDIRFFDEEKGEFAVLDGVFGSNFLCASAKMEGFMPVDVRETVFEKVVVDMRKGLLGFDIRDDYARRR